VPIKTKENKTIYILFGNSVESRAERGMIVIALRIENDELMQCPFFKTATQTLKIISYTYNAASSQFKGQAPIMHLSRDHKQLFIPIVNGIYNEQLSNKYLVYKFDGYQFVYDKNAK
jgi:hypothetical protein